jgi:hypothetical protein
MVDAEPVGTIKAAREKRLFYALRPGLRQRGSVFFSNLRHDSRGYVKNICSVRSASLRACLRQSGVVCFSNLAALFRFAHPWLKAMGYQAVP